MMTEGENDNDTVTSLDQFPSTGECTPAQWTNSKKLKTPTPSFPRTFDSNMSSVTCMKYAILQDSSQRENVTPLRDLMPLEQEVPYEPCQLPMNNEGGSANKENDSPTTVQVISPATAFRMKKAVFETKAQAYKSPNRKQRARHVSLFDSSPNAKSATDISTSPNSAIVTEMGDDSSQIVTATTTVEVVPTVLEMKPHSPNSSKQEEAEIIETDEYTQHINDEVEKKQLDLEQQTGVMLVKEATLCELASPMPGAPVTASAGESETAVSTPTSTSIISTWKTTVLVLILFAVAFLANRAYISNTSAMSSAPEALTATPPVYSDLEVYEEAVVGDTTGEFIPFAGIEDASTSEVQNSIGEEMVELSDAQVAIGGNSEPSFLRDVEELGTALSFLLRHHLHTAVSSYQTHHAPVVKAALSGLRAKMQPVAATLVAGVKEFHHTIDTSDLKHEWVRVSAQVATRVEEQTSRWKSALVGAKQQLYDKAPLLPVAEEALGRGMRKLQLAAKANLLAMHRFIKKNEVLCEEYSF